jgi:hypothetical protein
MPYFRPGSAALDNRGWYTSVLFQHSLMNKMIGIPSIVSLKQVYMHPFSIRVQCSFRGNVIFFVSCVFFRLREARVLIDSLIGSECIYGVYWTGWTALENNQRKRHIFLRLSSRLSYDSVVRKQYTSIARKSKAATL